MTDTAPTLLPTVSVPSGARKRLHVITWGCQMNVYDSGRMADVLAPLGYMPVDTPDGADMVILNTCHIRDKAAEKVFSELGRLRKLKDAAGGKMLLAVAGCVAQAEGKEILTRAPFVDLVLGPQTYHRLPEMVARTARAGGGVVETDFPAEDKFDFLPEQSAPQGVSAFLTIQEGCDKFCSFCVVPYTRGAEQSRSATTILAEAKRLIAQGSREIALLGQNVNAWHGEAPDGSAWGLGRLLREMAGLPGLTRLRYATSHPRDMDDDLIEAHRDLPMLLPFLHLPVQSGSDRILAAMNRKHTADDFRRLVDRLKTARPDLALSSDFIIGHPGETEADFQATMALVRDIGFALAYSFKYSQRPGTPAAGAAGQVTEAEKDRRLQELQALLRKQQNDFNAACAGTRMSVLFTGPGRHPGQIAGRSHYLQPVHVMGPASLIGDEIAVRIQAAHPNSLSGTLIQETQRLTHPIAGSLAPMATAPTGGKAITVQFNDNMLLPLLLGDHDRHLVRMEQALGVRMSCRGNRIAIAGDSARVEAAQSALQGLWRRLERGESVGRPDVEAAIKMADLETDPRLPLSDLPAIRTRRGAVGPRSPGQVGYMEALASHEMVFGVGPAGTGKTYLAVAQAVAALQAGRVDRIVLSRPAVEAGERLGFLPGDMKEKIDPYLRPLYDALNDMMPPDQVIKRLTSGEIEVAPLAFMRGRTLAHAYAILDEAQNTTPVQMKMFLTRMGEGTHMVITGDLTQVDLPNGVRSGLRDALDTLEGVQGIKVVRFDNRDVVRHPLVGRIVDAYDQRAAAEGDTRRESMRVGVTSDR